MSHHQPKDEPSKARQEELRKHPEDKDLKVDVGLDESMDASDPISETRARDDDPHPSSDAPDEEE